MKGTFAFGQGTPQVPGETVLQVEACSYSSPDWGLGFEEREALTVFPLPFPEASTRRRTLLYGDTDGRSRSSRIRSRIGYREGEGSLISLVILGRDHDHIIAFKQGNS
jgi:hypothetical protein